MEFNVLTASNQQIFDRAVTAVVLQGRKAGESNAEGGFRCMYRAPNGDKCAAGHVLNDDQIPVEGQAAHCMKVDLRYETRALIGALQGAHDSADPSNFVPSFLHAAKGVAERFNLL